MLEFVFILLHVPLAATIDRRVCQTKEEREKKKKKRTFLKQANFSPTTRDDSSLLLSAHWQKLFALGERGAERGRGVLSLSGAAEVIKFRTRPACIKGHDIFGVNTLYMSVTDTFVVLFYR
ncbi:hypothetical protein M514_06627, partial [Trichuris suis]